MAWTTADIPDQTGRVAVVTGANGGLGLETARELARKGAHVVMAARNMEKAEQARADILGDIPDASLELQQLDLASLASVRAAAERILSIHDTIDLLINNAGVMGIPEQRTEDGFEMQFGTNHLGHFAFTALLMPAILRSPDGRVVTVTSTGRHYRAKLDPENPHLEGQLRTLASVRPIEDGQRPLRPRVAAASRCRRILRAEPRGSPRVRQYQPPGQQLAPERWWPKPALLSRRRPPGGSEPRPREPSPNYGQRPTPGLEAASSTRPAG